MFRIIYNCNEKYVLYVNLKKLYFILKYNIINYFVTLIRILFWFNLHTNKLSSFAAIIALIANRNHRNKFLNHSWVEFKGRWGGGVSVVGGWWVGEIVGFDVRKLK